MRLGRTAAALLAVLVTVSLTAPVAAAPASARADDPRWVFYAKDKRHHTSPWFAGARRIMIPFGCTDAPYYSPDPRCRGGRGFHHGLDLAMPCGTRLFAPVRLRVVSNDSLGRAYGEHPLRLRNRAKGYDLVIGHTRRVFVREGQRVRPGTVFARAGDSGAPDGCHLHFEKRAVGGGLSTAVKPRRLLQLTPRARG